MNKIFYLLISSAGIIVIGSLVIYSVESNHPDSQINSMLDAVWWNVSTVTTGYDDVVLNPAFGYTASKFSADYGNDLSQGQKITVLVKVLGEPESENSQKRAKEIRHLQSAVLKFCSFAGATNVRSDTWNNEFTATVTTSLAKVLEKRSDVISVTILEDIQKITKENLDKLSPKKQQFHGRSIDEINCKSDYILMVKSSGGLACVKPSSVEKLTERDWITVHTSQKMKIFSEKLFFTLQGDDQVGSLSNAKWSTGTMMTYITSSDDGSLVLATSSGSDVVYAFDSSQGKLITTIPVGETPKGVKIHPDGNIVFVANESSGTISVIDAELWMVTKEIKVGKIPHNIRFDSQGNTAYVTLQGEDKIAIIDVSSLEMTGSILVERLPHNLDLSSDDRYLYTANIGTSDVAVIDLANKEIIKRIEVSTGHHGIDVTNDGQRIYVSGIGSDKVNVIDAESLELIKQIDVGEGPHGIRASVDGSKVYVGVTKTNEILVIDTNTLDIEEKIQTGNIPFWLAIPGNP